MTEPGRARGSSSEGTHRVGSGWIARAMLLAALIATAASTGAGTASGGMGMARVGSPAPDFTLRLLDGKRVTLSGFRGKPVLVNFWHSG